MSMDKVLKFFIIAGILIMASSLAYYFVYFLPNKERLLESARQECASSTIDAMHKNPQGFLVTTDVDLFYKLCMNKKGFAD